MTSHNWTQNEVHTVWKKQKQEEKTDENFFEMLPEIRTLMAWCCSPPNCPLLKSVTSWGPCSRTWLGRNRQVTHWDQWKRTNYNCKLYRNLRSINLLTRFRNWFLFLLKWRNSRKTINKKNYQFNTEINFNRIRPKLHLIN